MPSHREFPSSFYFQFCRGSLSNINPLNNSNETHSLSEDDHSVDSIELNLRDSRELQFSQLTNDEDNLHDDTPAALSLQDVQDADLDDTMQLIVNGVKPSFKLHEHPNMKKGQKLFLESVNHVRKDAMAYCSFCKEPSMDTELSSILGPDWSRQCKKCWKQSTTDACVHIYSDANNLDPFPRNDHCNLPKLTGVMRCHGR